MAGLITTKACEYSCHWRHTVEVMSFIFSNVRLEEMQIILVLCNIYYVTHSVKGSKYELIWILGQKTLICNLNKHYSINPVSDFPRSAGIEEGPFEH